VTTTEQTQAFDTATYELEGTPKLQGTKAGTIVIAFEPFELDHTDADHMLLAGRLENGQTITINVQAAATKRAWIERIDADPHDQLGRRYTLTIRDVT